MRRRFEKLSAINWYAAYEVHDLTNYLQWWIEYCVPKFLLTTVHPSNVLALLIDEEFSRFELLVSCNCDT